jgi:hypothetical protein
MEVNIWLYASVALSQKEPQVPTEWEAEWVREPVSTLQRAVEKINVSGSCREPNPYSSVVQPGFKTEVRREDSCWARSKRLYK